MPLRDHFRGAVNDRHTWDELHGLWPAMMVVQIAKTLPPDYLVAPRIHLGGAVANWLPDTNGGASTATWTAVEPTLRVETDLPDVDEYEVRIYDVARDRRLVAAVELVSPSNKDRPETRQAFVTKCAALLQQNVSIAIVDVVTVRAFNLYADLLEVIGHLDSSVETPPSSIYAVACRGTIPRKRWTFEAWHRPLKLGAALPSLPLWLADDLAVTLDLESTYEATCQVLRIQ